jgi:hypothetical protein
MRFRPSSFLRGVLLLALVPVASATTLYVNGVTGSDSNDCLLATTACETIGHAISLAHSGDSIRVASATYKENLSIGKSLTITGAGVATTVIDGGGGNTVVTVSSTDARVGLANVTIRNGGGGCGASICGGGGILNQGILTITNSTINGNFAADQGGGILNLGKLTMTDSTVSGNKVRGMPGLGGGIANDGIATINSSSVTGNTVSGVFGAGFGGGIGNQGNLTVTNSTITRNTASAWGGGIGNEAGNLRINNSTIGGNNEYYGGVANYSGAVTLQNSIVANNSSGDCYARNAVTSKGYNLSSDETCNFGGPGDLNNTDPKLGTLGNHGGPTQTIPEILGSPTIDAGNPSGCRDSQGHLLTTDQRGYPRPGKDKHDHRCDMGAYESQTD